MSARHRSFIARLSAALLLVAAPALAQGPDSLKANPYELDSLVVQGTGAIQYGPMRGLELTPDQLTTNVQGASGAEVQASGAIGLGEFMNRYLGSVNLNDYQGNLLQADVVFRGFSASSQLGTPQGLSVFLDGVRVNEAFGDVVNWDLLPLNAIKQMNVFPGSNALFGLNTLGGAVSLQTRSGFTDKGIDVEGTGGSFARRQVKIAAGGARGNVAGFGAFTVLDEDGWRDNSPSNMLQAFGRFDWQLGRNLITASGLIAGNDLVGNGLVPIEMYQKRSTSVFSSPDKTENRLYQFMLSGLFPTSSITNITAQASRRETNRNQVAGSAYYAFENFDLNDSERARLDQPPNACRYLDANRDGTPDETFMGLDPFTGDSTFAIVPLNPGCEPPVQPSYEVRNGFACTFNVAGPCQDPGVVEGTPIGVLSRTQLAQVTYSTSAQFNINASKSKAMVGVALDAASSSYFLGQQLALMDENRRVYADADNIDVLYRAAQVEVPINDFDGTTTTASIYGSETFSPMSNLHLTAALRYNYAWVSNTLRTRAATSGLVPLSTGGLPYNSGDLHTIQNGNVLYPAILCPTTDLSSCDLTASPVLVDVDGEVTETSDDYHYGSLNPSLGASWVIKPGFDVFANFSMGARTPSTVELGCAFDGTLVNSNAGKTDADGNPLPVVMRPRSLTGPTCTLPGAMSADPYLPQIRSYAYEAGARGKLTRKLNWSASVYRTDLTNDIAFVGVSAQRSYFQTVGNTRREGLELGIGGTAGRVQFQANYALTNATYQSTFYMLSPHNSSADFNQNSQPDSRAPTPTAAANNGLGTFFMIRVDPGAHIPGVPLHNVNANINVLVLPRWYLGFGMVAHSMSYIRGNENNLHTTGGTDQQTGIWIPNASDTVVLEQIPVAPGRAFTESGSIPGYVTFSLNTAVRIGRDAVLSLQINNLFNEVYYTAGQLGLTPFAPSVYGAIGPSGWNYNSADWQNTSFIAPGAPRAIFLSLRYATPRLLGP